MRIGILYTVSRRPCRRERALLEKILMDFAGCLSRKGVDANLYKASAQAAPEAPANLSAGCPENSYHENVARGYLNASEVFERGHEFDIIHNHCGLLPLTYSGMTRTPVLTTISEQIGPDLMPFYEKYNRASYFVSVSRAARESGLEYLGTVYPGLDLNGYDFNPEPGDYLIFMSDIHPGSGAAEALDIAEGSGMKIVVSGAVLDKDYFNSEVKPRLKSDSVVFDESPGPEKALELLGRAYALLLPVGCDVPFSITALESMACGTPVLAFDRGGLPEVITDGKTGFLVSSVKDAVDRIASIKGLDRASCRSAVEERFTMERMAEDYIGVYERIISESAREDRRPWGFYTVLADCEDHKVKRITVYPGQRLSLQRHHRRTEHWYVMKGQAVVTLDKKEIKLKSGQAVDIPVGAWHRIQNSGKHDLVFIEVQTGEYFGEDDIDRTEDDYGRVE